MKKFLVGFSILLILIGISGGILAAFPNEISFKIANFRGISAVQKQDFSTAKKFFEQAEKSFPSWKLAGESNKLGVLYQEKKYQELSSKLAKISDTECSLRAKKIPSFCENIFYLNGLVQYRLGEKLETKKQKTFFEKAISEFQKTLALNPQNKWAEENIAFILKNFAEKQAQEQVKNKQNSQDKKNNSGEEKSSDKQNNQDSSKKENSLNQNQEQKNSSEKTSEENKQNPSDQKGNSANQQNQAEKNLDKNSDKNQKGTSSKPDSKNPAKKSKNGSAGNQENKKQKPVPSRLPQNIQQELERVQKQLEQDKNQQGFNRSRSAAEKDKQNSADPFNMFANDPFFQNFFGNDPFFNPTPKNLSRTIQNPNEKDW